MTTSETRPADLPVAGRWVWLFPATLIVHVLEEATTGGTFPVWVSRVAGVDLSMGEYLVLNGLALIAVVIGTVLAVRWRWSGWPVAGLGSVVAMNGLLHVLATLATGSWSPGVVSGTLLWLPLGAFALTRSARRAPPRDLVVGLAIGVVAHVIIVLAILLA